MPSKTEEYLALAQRTANGLTRYWESWTAYLTTASRLYKYRFEDQLMIYAQRPDATACADYDIWNNRMNRYVRRGSKGIALLDESSGYPRLHYVFDVSDTGVRRNSRDPDLWQYNDDLKQPVSDALTAASGQCGLHLGGAYRDHHGTQPCADQLHGLLLHQAEYVEAQVLVSLHRHYYVLLRRHDPHLPEQPDAGPCQ